MAPSRHLDQLCQSLQERACQLCIALAGRSRVASRSKKDPFDGVLDVLWETRKTGPKFLHLLQVLLVQEQGPIIIFDTNVQHSIHIHEDNLLHGRRAGCQTGVH